VTETITREQAGEHVLACAEDIRDVLKNEELWAKLKFHLTAAWNRGYRDALKEMVK
jgi:hypothetical protein